MLSKKIFLFPLAAVLATVCAQQVAAQAPSVPVGKIAVIFSEAFQDSKVGIAKFAVIQNQLAAEFKKPQDELDAAAKQLQSLQDEVAKLQNSPSADPKIVQAKMAQIDQVTKDSQRKLEDTKASYQTRRTNLLTPLQEDVGKALDAFAKTHGITMIIDGSQVPGVIYAADTLDITKVFISEYNSKNPPAAATAAKP